MNQGRYWRGVCPSLNDKQLTSSKLRCFWVFRVLRGSLDIPRLSRTLMKPASSFGLPALCWHIWSQHVFVNVSASHYLAVFSQCERDLILDRPGFECALKTSIPHWCPGRQEKWRPAFDMSSMNSATEPNTQPALVRHQLR